MGKKKFYIIILGLIILLTGCGKEEKENLGDNYILGKDNQYYFSGNYLMTESENAYYFFSGQYLYSKDKSTGEVTVLCDKPDCLHNKEMDFKKQPECNAYYYTASSIQYYDGKLYILSELNDDNYNDSDMIAEEVVYEEDISGSTRKKVVEPKEKISAMIVHRGELYVSFTDFLDSFDVYEKDAQKRENSGYRIEKYDMDNFSKKPEIILKKTGQFGQINSMWAYGNNVYFSIVDGYDPIDYCVYNILDESCHDITESITGNMTVVDGKLLYSPYTMGEITDSDYEEYFKAHENTKCVLADAQGRMMEQIDVPFCEYHYSNGELIINDNENQVLFERFSRNERAIAIYDKNGKLLREMKTGNDTMPVFGMNKDYYFYMKRSQDENLNPEIWVIDLKRIDDESYGGELFFSEADIQ